MHRMKWQICRACRQHQQAKNVRRDRKYRCNAMPKQRRGRITWYNMLFQVPRYPLSIYWRRRASATGTRTPNIFYVSKMFLSLPVQIELVGRCTWNSPVKTNFPVSSSSFFSVSAISLAENISDALDVAYDEKKMKWRWAIFYYCFVSMGWRPCVLCNGF